MYRHLILTGILAGMLFWLIGCGGSSSTNSGMIQGIGNPGTITLKLADAPLDDVSAVNVTVTRVDLRYDGVEDSLAIQSSGGDASPLIRETDVANDEPVSPEDDDATPPESDDAYVTIFNGEKAVDLIAMANKPLSQLAEITSPLPSGYFKQVVVYLKNGGSVTKTDGTIVPLQVPSGRLRLHISLFVQPEETADVLLDFDLSAPGSLRQVSNGNQLRYVLTPMLHVSKVKNTGSITGILHASTGTADNATVSVTATGYNRSTIVEMEGTADRTGTLHLHGLPAGSSTITGTVEYDGVTTTFTRDITMTGKGSVDIGAVELTAPPAVE